jgi:serine/threonine protein kinase
MYLLLEYMKRGDLINVLKKKTEDERKGDGGNSQTVDTLAQFSPLSDFDLWHIFRQIVSGVRYLHFQNIVHGDIKPQVAYIVFGFCIDGFL